MMRFVRSWSKLCVFLLLGQGIVEAQTKPKVEQFAVFRTSDQGRSWMRADAGLPGNARVNALGSIGEAVLAGTDAGIFVSSDRGGKWQAAQGASGRILALASLGELAFAGTDGAGLLTSADRGRSWVSAPSFPKLRVRSLLAQGEKVYAGTDTKGVYVSSDGGSSWVLMSEGLPKYSQIFSMAAVQGNVFAGLYAKGLYVWSEVSQRWTKVGEVVPLALARSGQTLVAGHNPGGIHRSGDLGRSWQQATFANSKSFGLPETSPNAPVWEMGSDGKILFAGVSTGIYYSLDKGQTWTRAQNGLPPESPGIAFLVRPGYALASTTLRTAN